jgi:hypothetical protein
VSNSIIFKVLPPDIPYITICTSSLPFEASLIKLSIAKKLVEFPASSSAAKRNAPRLSPSAGDAESLFKTNIGPALASASVDLSVSVSVLSAVVIVTPSLNVAVVAVS